jgi:hypothetical protein
MATIMKNKAQIRNEKAMLKSIFTDMSAPIAPALPAFRSARFKPEAKDVIGEFKNNGYVSIHSVRKVFNSMFNVEECLYAVFWTHDHAPAEFVGEFFERCFTEFSYFDDPRRNTNLDSLREMHRVNHKACLKLAAGSRANGAQHVQLLKLAKSSRETFGELNILRRSLSTNIEE